MTGLGKALTALAALAFALAVVTVFTGPLIPQVQSEGYSRAAGNLALIAIAWELTFGSRAAKGS